MLSFLFSEVGEIFAPFSELPPLLHFLITLYPTHKSDHSPLYI